MQKPRAGSPYVCTRHQCGASRLILLGIKILLDELSNLRFPLTKLGVVFIAQELAND